MRTSHHHLAMTRRPHRPTLVGGRRWNEAGKKRVEAGLLKYDSMTDLGDNLRREIIPQFLRRRRIINVDSTWCPFQTCKGVGQPCK